MALNTITASVCHDTLKVEFTVPEDVNITDEQIIEEIQKDCYRHSLINPFTEGTMDIKLDTPTQLSTFVSWLTKVINEKW